MTYTKKLPDIKVKDIIMEVIRKSLIILRIVLSIWKVIYKIGPRFESEKEQKEKKRKEQINNIELEPR